MKKKDVTTAMLVLALVVFCVLMIGLIAGLLIIDKNIGGQATSKWTLEDEEGLHYLVTVKPGGGGLSRTYETSKAVFDAVEVGNWYEFEMSGMPRDYIEGVSE